MEAVSEVRTNGSPRSYRGRTPSPIDRCGFFISVKLAIFTLIILAIASIFGTIVEQNQPRKSTPDLRGLAFTLMNRINCSTCTFLVVPSPVGLFTVNLTCCTIDRFPKMLKVVRTEKETRRELEKTSRSQTGGRRRNLSDWAAKYS